MLHITHTQSIKSNYTANVVIVLRLPNTGTLHSHCPYVLTESIITEALPAAGWRGLITRVVPVPLLCPLLIVQGSHFFLLHTVSSLHNWGGRVGAVNSEFSLAFHG